ncbi:MAG: glycosyltransferase family 1 protein [Acidobacteriota bacterium]
MRIGIDSRELEGNPTGVGRYLEGLLKNWASLNIEFFLFFRNEIPELKFLDSPNFEKILVKKKTKNWVWEQVGILNIINKLNLDLYFSPSYSIPLLTSVPTAFALHDLSFEYNRKWFNKKEGFKRRFLAKYSSKKAKTIFTGTDFIKNEIIKHYKTEEKKIRVIPYGVKPIFHFKEYIDLEKGKGKTILTVGALFQRRNIPLLLKSFRKIIEKNPDVTLKIIGENRTFPKIDFKRICEDLGIEKKVYFIEYLQDEDLVKQYYTSDLFVSLSEYEGFGFPVLEALACGLPALLYKNLCYLEIFKDVAFFVEKMNPSEISSQILEILNMKLGTERRKEIAEYTKGFSWENTARKTISSLLELIN